MVSTDSRKLVWSRFTNSSISLAAWTNWWSTVSCKLRFKAVNLSCIALCSSLSPLWTLARSSFGAALAIFCAKSVTLRSSSFSNLATTAASLEAAACLRLLSSVLTSSSCPARRPANEARISSLLCFIAVSSFWRLTSSRAFVAMWSLISFHCSRTKSVLLLSKASMLRSNSRWDLAPASMAIRVGAVGPHESHLLDMPL
mmetsp:Transcript_58857/g.137486  ORF Transcript_58857/g.137486 Transcript_58857/m.137486 type:complete len:200 (+) Transcript_58857:2189-2788(+)